MKMDLLVNIRLCFLVGDMFDIPPTQLRVRFDHDLQRDRPTPLPERGPHGRRQRIGLHEAQLGRK